MFEDHNSLRQSEQQYPYYHLIILFSTQVADNICFDSDLVWRMQSIIV